MTHPDPEQPQYTQHLTNPIAAQPSRKSRRSVPLIATIGIALGVGLVSCIIGAAIGGAGTHTNTAATANGVKTVISIQPSPVISTVTKTVTVTQAPAAPPPPPTALSQDGTYLVGTDIQPGTYRAKNIVDSCYWGRLSSTDGTSDIIANNVVNAGGQAIVTIKPSDKAFETRGCGDWQKIG